MSKINKEALLALGFIQDKEGVMKKLINEELGLIVSWDSLNKKYRFTLDTWMQVDFLSAEVNKEEIDNNTILGLEAMVKVLVSTLKGLKDAS